MSAENPPTTPAAPERLSGVPEDVTEIEWDQVPVPPEVSPFDEAREMAEEKAIGDKAEAERVALEEIKTRLAGNAEEKFPAEQELVPAKPKLEEVAKLHDEVEVPHKPDPKAGHAAESKEHTPPVHEESMEHETHHHENHDSQVEHADHDNHDHSHEGHRGHGHGKKLKPWQKMSLDALGVTAATVFTIGGIGEVFVWNLIKNLWVYGMAWMKKLTGGLLGGGGGGGSNPKGGGGGGHAPAGGGH